MSVGTLEEIIDDNNPIESTSVGSDYRLQNILCIFLGYFFN